ncbi:PLDc N-terminal domain-containing protein [Streptomyces sp. NPDC001492]
MTAFVAFALYAVVVVLCLHAFVDCVRTPDSRVRHLPKAIWLLLMFMAPVLGGIAWRNLGKGPALPSPLPGQYARDRGGRTWAQV